MRELRSKIKSLKQLAPIIAKLKSANKKIVMAHGVFDLIHYGHMYQLNQARRLGDVLVVSVKTDRYIQKGLGRPVFNTRIRAECLASLECVDFVLLCNEDGPYHSIPALQPDIYIKGSEYEKGLKDPKNPINKDRYLVESSGGIMRFIKMVRTKTVPIHSSLLIRQNLNMLSKSYKKVAK